MKRTYPITAIIAAILAGFIGYLVQNDGKADWLRVQTPDAAETGRLFPVEVTLLKDTPGKYLRADLHWINEAGETQGYLAGSKAQKITEGKKVYIFEVPLGTEKQASYVYPVVYASREGTWGPHSTTAILDAVPVVDATGKKPDSLEQIQRTHGLSGNHGLIPPEKGRIHYLTSGVWFALALLGLVFRKNRYAAGIIAAGALSGVWEYFNFSIHIANALRSLTSDAGIYTDRRGVQVFITLIFMILSVQLIAYLLSKPDRAGKTVAAVSFVIFWGIAVLRILSLHETDFLLAKRIGGIGLGQGLGFTASLVCLITVGVKVFLSGISASGKKRTIT